ILAASCAAGSVWREKPRQFSSRNAASGADRASQRVGDNPSIWISGRGRDDQTRAQCSLRLCSDKLQKPMKYTKKLQHARAELHDARAAYDGADEEGLTRYIGNCLAATRSVLQYAYK